MKEIIILEKRLKQKMNLIENGELTAKESKIHILFNRLNELDIASYEKHIKIYKDLLLENA